VSAPRSLVVLIGNPVKDSRTRAAAIRSGELLQAALGTAGLPVEPPAVVDLAGLGPGLLLAEDEPTAVALKTVERADLVLMATPTFKGTYTGLLKVFIDLLPRGGLTGAVVVPLMTAGRVSHRTAVDTTLRPVLLELGARVPTPGISVLEAELGRLEEVFNSWWRQHGAVTGAVLAAPQAGEERC